MLESPRTIPKIRRYRLIELWKLWESEVFWAWDFVQFQAGKVKCQGSGVKRDLLGPLSEGFLPGRLSGEAPHVKVLLDSSGVYTRFESCQALFSGIWGLLVIKQKKLPALAKEGWQRFADGVVCSRKFLNH